MTDKSMLPESIQRLVVDVKDDISADQLSAFQPVPTGEEGYHSPETLDVYERQVRITDSSHRLRTMLDAWRDQQSDERSLRSKFAGAMLGAVLLEILIAATALFLLGFGIMKLDQWVANVFFGGVFLQTVGMASVVLRYLFPDKSSGLLDVLQKL